MVAAWDICVRFAYIGIVSPLIIGGVIGNCVAFIVLTLKPKLNPNAILLLTLTVLDTLILVFKAIIHVWPVLQLCHNVLVRQLSLCVVLPYFVPSGLCCADVYYGDHNGLILESMGGNLPTVLGNRAPDNPPHTYPRGFGNLWIVPFLCATLLGNYSQ